MKLFMRLKDYINNTTMYRTVLYALLGLVVWSWILSMIGVIHFFIVDMVIQLVVVVGIGYGVDRLMAYIFKILPNPESILITSLIVYFLILPDGSMKNLTLISVAVAFAALSKYLITWRGKHIFNPAALGVAVIGLVGLGFAGWWVATPWLLPFVAILGGITVYKTRRWDMVIIYLLTSLLMIIAQAAIKGTFEPNLIVMAFTSFPLVFFACFMLTEPQTLAPKKMQRNLIAAGVAIVGSSHISVGVLSTSPEMALLLGNIAALFFMSQRSVALKLIGRRKLPGDQVEYHFESKRPLAFEAGQYAELHVPHKKTDGRGYRRMFTIASRPGTNSVTMITRHPDPASTFKKTLLKIPIGRQLRITGVWGDFTLPKDPKQKILLIGGGVGVTPFMSHLAWLKHTGQVRDVVLIYSNRTTEDAINLDEYKSIAKIIMHEGVLTKDDLNTYVADIKERNVYVSGPPSMVDAVTKQAKELGSALVHRDFFAGY